MWQGTAVATYHHRSPEKHVYVFSTRYFIWRCLTACICTIVESMLSILFLLLCFALEMLGRPALIDEVAEYGHSKIRSC